MKRSFPLVHAALLLSGAAFSQSTTQPTFDVADVHVSAPGTSDGFASLRPGRVELRGRTMLALIQLAYDVEERKVMGGPSWLATTRFDIVAKAASGSSPEALKTMLQTLLADRFKLVTHQEEKPLPVFVLTVSSRGLRMKESSPGQTDCKRDQQGFTLSLTCHNLPVSSLAETLRGSAPGYFNVPVIGRTGLKGEYDFTLKWVGKARVGQAMPDGEAPGVSMFEALEKQIGLKAEPQTEKFPVIVVDKVNDKPTDNPPGTMERLPPPVTEFEVATIRPTRPDAREEFDMRNGRIDAKGISLKDMILFANRMDDDGSVMGGEKWLETDRFDLIAKTAPTASEEELRSMLNTLLKERFKLAVHIENHPVPVFALTAPNKKAPKLKEADPASRSQCKMSVENGLRTYTCQNTTMAQFAERIREVAQGYLNHRVVDLTGVAGAYDFAVSWTPVGRAIAARGDGAAAGAVPSAADPNNGITVFEGVEKLGLKLAPQSTPLPVIVIDHVERTPTEN